MRHCYSEQEGVWLDTVCRAMNRWAMATTEIEAEARLWTSQPAQAARLESSSLPDSSLDLDVGMLQYSSKAAKRRAPELSGSR